MVEISTRPEMQTRQALEKAWTIPAAVGKYKHPLMKNNNYATAVVD